MAEERITETESPSGRTHTHTTVVSDGGGRSSGIGWVAVILLLVVAGVAVWFFSGMSGSEVAKDNAVAEAAGEVGDAASQVGDAAQQAADNLGN